MIATSRTRKSVLVRPPDPQAIDGLHQRTLSRYRPSADRRPDSAQVDGAASGLSAVTVPMNPAGSLPSVEVTGELGDRKQRAHSLMCSAPG